MPDRKKRNPILTKTTLVSSMVVFIFLLIALVLLTNAFAFLYSPISNNIIQVTIIAYNTPTQIPSANGNLFTPTYTQIPSLQKFSKGLKIMVQGTGGDGLRIHQDAGQNSPTIYLAIDGDLFTISDGPIVTGGYVWWKIESTLAEKISGWAAEDFLQIRISSH